jgi:hypothetical protein
MRSAVGAICIFALELRDVGFLCVDLDVEVVFDVEFVLDVELDFTGVTVFFVCDVPCGFRAAVVLAVVDPAANAGIAK